jgi:hypothetical protein
MCQDLFIPPPFFFCLKLHASMHIQFVFLQEKLYAILKKLLGQEDDKPSI